MPTRHNPGRGVTTAVEDHGGPALTNELTHLAKQARQYLAQPGVGLGRDDEERLALGVVDPVVGGGRQVTSQKVAAKT